MHTLRNKVLAAALVLTAAFSAFTAPTHLVAQAVTMKPAAAAPLDINTATADQLKALPGIGDAYAKRIIDGRPYTAKNQLTIKGIIPQKTYDGIKDQIVATHPKK
jgi:competence protein ComEA